MMLNADEIFARGIISSGFHQESLKDAGYDLRIETLFSKTEEGEMQRDDHELDLKPHGIAAIVSRETIKLPPDVCAYASVKTSLCREGVLAINIGIIDPNWNGPISSVLLNFGTKEHTLKTGDAFLRLTFHALKQPSAPRLGVTRVRDEYTAEINRKFEKRLADSFLDFNKGAEKASKRFTDDLRNALFKYVSVIAVGLAALTFFLNWGVMAVASRAMPYDEVQLRAKEIIGDSSKALQKQIDDLKEENAQLRQQIEASAKNAIPTGGSSAPPNPSKGGANTQPASSKTK